MGKEKHDRKRRSQASSAETIGNNDDILTEILIFLPIKSLTKFKSVSKHWLSLISSPNINLRLNQNPKTKPMISGIFVNNLNLMKEGAAYDFINLNDSNPTPFRFLTNYNPSSHENHLIHSCNGLFLCRSKSTSSCYCNYYIYNHTTNQYTKLPQLLVDYHSIICASLAFDPSISSHYKVICVKTTSSNDDDDQTYCQIEIYSSKTGVWRLSDSTFTVPKRFNSEDAVCWNRGVFWNGAIHWILPCWGTCLYVDVDEEKLRYIPMPPLDNKWNCSSSYLGESQGHLHLIVNYTCISRVFEVYEMEQDYSGWFVKYQVNLLSIEKAYPDMVFSILCLVRVETDEDDSYLVLHVPEKNCIRYNFKDMTFKIIHEFSSSYTALEHDHELIDWDRVFPYSHSLACVSFDD